MQDLNVILVVLVISLIVFLACREIVCWYWKLNKITDSLETIVTELKKINEKSNT